MFIRIAQLLKQLYLRIVNVSMQAYDFRQPIALGIFGVFDLAS